MREIIFDTETTGLSPNDGDRVIEIGAVEFVRRFPTGRTFHVYLNPEGRSVHPDAQAVHGISNDMLADKPTFSGIFDEFIEFFGDGTLVAHNANFDMGFLNAELKRIGKPAINLDRVVDSLALARRKHPGSPNSLDALCDRYGISRGHRQLHGALLDSELLAEVYLELTGGRQAGFELENSGDEKTSNRSSSDQSQAGPQKQRPTRLPSRLSDDDIAAHQDFIARMGDEAIWLKSGLIKMPPAQSG